MSPAATDWALFREVGRSLETVVSFLHCSIYHLLVSSLCNYFSLDIEDISWIATAVPPARITYIPFRFPCPWSNTASATKDIAHIPALTMARVYKPFFCRLISLFFIWSVSPIAFLSDESTESLAQGCSFLAFYPLTDKDAFDGACERSRSRMANSFFRAWFSR